MVSLITPNLTERLLKGPALCTGKFYLSLMLSVGTPWYTVNAGQLQVNGATAKELESNQVNKVALQSIDTPASDSFTYVIDGSGRVTLKTSSGKGSVLDFTGNAYVADGFIVFGADDDHIVFASAFDSPKSVGMVSFPDNNMIGLIR